MRYGECYAPFDLPNEAYTGGSRTSAAAPCSWPGSSSDGPRRQPKGKGKGGGPGVPGGRTWERYRGGHLGGRQRHGDRGGHDNWYYQGYYRAKGKGKGYLRAFMAVNGPPPNRGGTHFHNRREDDEPDSGAPDEQLYG